MKKLLILLITFMISKTVFSQLVKENLFALPSHTYSDFTGVSSPTIGSLVYNLTDNKLYFYNGTAWVVTDTDTTFLSNRINMRLRTIDTTTMLSKYINFATNGLIKNTQTLQLGGSLVQATSITTSGVNTFAFSGLTSGSKLNDSIMVSVASSGIIKRISPSNLLSGYMKYTDTASMLSPYLRKGDTTNMLSKYIYNANNGLTKTGKNTQLGGTLTQATTVTTSSSNTFALAGLQGGNSNDSLLVQNPSTNAIRRTVFPKTNVYKTTTTQANSSNSTFATINSLQFSYASGKKYKVKVYLVYNAAATGTGIQLGPNSVTGNIWYSTLVNTAATANQQLSGYNATTVLVSTSSRATTGNVALFECTLEATGSATFSLQFASEVNGSAITIQSNSRMEVEEIL